MAPRTRGALVRRYGVRALNAVGLLGIASRTRFWWLARRAGTVAGVGPDGLPVPPPRLQLKTIGKVDDAFFLETGRDNARVLRERMAAHGREPEKLRTILDYGCGCGRVIRWWADLPDTSLHGCDQDRELVSWCETNLPTARFRANDLEPPLPYGDATFDAIYSISVLTHLTVSLQVAWAEELRRVLRPGGVALLTAMGDALAAQELLPREHRRYLQGEPVVLYGGLAGGRCAAFHPPAYFRDWLEPRWRIVAHYPGAPEGEMLQDLWMLERPAQP